jgi:hypothetical protein
MPNLLLNIFVILKKTTYPTRIENCFDRRHLNQDLLCDAFCDIKFKRKKNQLFFPFPFFCSIFYLLISLFTIKAQALVATADATHTLTHTLSLSPTSLSHTHTHISCMRFNFSVCKHTTRSVDHFNKMSNLKINLQVSRKLKMKAKQSQEYVTFTQSGSNTIRHVLQLGMISKFPAQHFKFLEAKR